MSNQDQNRYEQVKGYALYPVQEVKRLYQCMEQYKILCEQIKSLETENGNLKQKILQLSNHL